MPLCVVYQLFYFLFVCICVMLVNSYIFYCQFLVTNINAAYIFIIWEGSMFSGVPVLASLVQAVRTVVSLILGTQMQSHLWKKFDKQLQFPSGINKFTHERITFSLPLIILWLGHVLNPGAF